MKRTEWLDNVEEKVVQKAKQKTAPYANDFEANQNKKMLLHLSRKTTTQH